MAVTKTHLIKSTLKAAIDYICSPAKTDGKLLVSSYGCTFFLLFRKVLVLSKKPLSCFPDAPHGKIPASVMLLRSGRKNIGFRTLIDIVWKWVWKKGGKYSTHIFEPQQKTNLVSTDPQDFFAAVVQFQPTFDSTARSIVSTMCPFSFSPLLLYFPLL